MLDATPLLSLNPPRRLRFATVMALLFLIAGIARILHHVPWRDEIRAWQLDLSVASLAELRDATRYDGHPALWPLVLYPLSRVTSDFRIVQIVHVLISTASVWVVAAFAPWRRWQIVLICAGYFIAFEYTIIARNYGLGMLFFFAALAAVERRQGRWLFAACCAGAIQSNSFATLLVGCLGLVVIVTDHRAARRAGRPISARDYAWMLLPAASFLLALLAMLPGPTERYATPYDGTAPLRRLSVIFAGVGRALVPIPASVDTWWNTALLSIDHATARADPTLYHAMSAVAAILTIGLVWLTRNRTAALAFLALSIGSIVAFSFAAFAGSQRHYGHVMLALLGGWWLASSATARDAAPASRLDRRRDAVFTGLIAVQAIAGLVASYRDLTQPFSAAPVAGRWLREHGRGLPLAGTPDYAAVPVAAAAGVPFYSLDTWNRVTFNSQGPLSQLRPPTNDESVLLPALLRHLGQTELLWIRSGLLDLRPGASYALDVSDSADSPSGQTLILTSVVEFPDSAIADEAYTILHVRLVPAPPPATTPASPQPATDR